MVGGVCVRDSEMSGACGCENVRLQYVCVSYEVSECERGHSVFGVCEVWGKGAQLQCKTPGCVCVVVKKKPNLGPIWHRLGQVLRQAVNTYPKCSFNLPQKWSFYCPVKNFLDGTSEVISLSHGPSPSPKGKLRSSA